MPELVPFFSLIYRGIDQYSQKNVLFRLNKKYFRTEE